MAQRWASQKWEATVLYDLAVKLLTPIPPHVLRVKGEVQAGKDHWGPAFQGAELSPVIMIFPHKPQSRLLPPKPHTSLLWDSS